MSNGTVEHKLTSLKYQKVEGKKWVNGNLIVHVEQSKERNRYLIYWREEWKDDHAIVFDYSHVDGRICIVPIKVMFKSDFVTKKRAESYGDSLNWWSQYCSIDHELTQLVFKFENRWDTL
jgi:hypothetical protein